MNEYTITMARLDDLPLISKIELAAARLLEGSAPESVLAETTSQEELRSAQNEGRLWVALEGEVPIGFALIKLLEPFVAHLEEIDVDPAYGRRGIGQKLVSSVCEWAKSANYHSVTLTTFRDVPFNMPFYAKVGFEIVRNEELSDALRSVIKDETRRGLDPTRRVVMRRRCGREETPARDLTP